MRRNVVLAGVGGQGLLSIAAVLGEAARAEGLHLRQAEVHGMAQRGGIVESHIRYSDAPIYSDLICLGTADLILSLEPMETLRYLPFLSRTGSVVTSDAPVENIPAYPELAQLLDEIRALPRAVVIAAQDLAREAGSPRCLNMVMLGAGSSQLALPQDALVAAIETTFAGKPRDVIETNLRGFRLGLEAAAERLSD